MPGARTSAAKPSGQWATPSAGQGSGALRLNVQVRMTNDQEKATSKENGSDGRSAKDGEQTPNVELPTPNTERRREDKELTGELVGDFMIRIRASVKEFYGERM